MSRYTYDTDHAPLLTDTQRAELDEQADALRKWEAARREPRGFCGYSWTWWLMVAICGACALFFTFAPPRPAATPGPGRTSSST